jgi:hypothetical protein
VKVDGKIPEAVKKDAIHNFGAVTQAVFTQLIIVAEKREKYTHIILMENFYFFWVIHRFISA